LPNKLAIKLSELHYYSSAATRQAEREAVVRAAAAEAKRAEAAKAAALTGAHLILPRISAVLTPPALLSRVCSPCSRAGLSRRAAREQGVRRGAPALHMVLFPDPCIQQAHSKLGKLQLYGGEAASEGGASDRQPAPLPRRRRCLYFPGIPASDFNNS